MQNGEMGAKKWRNRNEANQLRKDVIGIFFAQPTRAMADAWIRKHGSGSSSASGEAALYHFTLPNLATNEIQKVRK